MKKTLLVSVCAVLLSAAAFAQTPSAPAEPYRNLAVWFATQSAPESLEKAKWALDDINAYRAAKGLREFPESILDAPNVAQPRRFLFRNRR